MNVEIPPYVREIAPQLGAGVPYALKVLAGRLVDEPDMGRPSGLPGILTVMVDGDPFEDCPDLAIGYIREPDRIEIRFVNLASVARPAEDAPQDLNEEQGQGQKQGQGQAHVQEQPVDHVADALTVREIADAWRRITGWLQHNAPDSYAALRADAGLGAIAASGRGPRPPDTRRAAHPVAADRGRRRGQWLGMPSG